LEAWLKEATRCLARDSAAQVRSEIQEHYEAAREAAVSDGSTAAEAERIAIAQMGDPRAANRQYRKVLLTSAEARLLRKGNWEVRAICSRPGLKRLLLAVPAAALLASAVLFFAGAIDTARLLLGGGIALGLLFVAPFLPVYTPPRARVFRIVKWVAMIAMLGLAFGPNALRWCWLLASCLWPLAWTEWTRTSIRRKLPVAKWPKQLYL
jgi:hypothetical protein